MAYFNSAKIKTIPQPIPDTPPYVPPTPPTPPQADDGSTPVVPRGTFTGVANIILYTISDDNNVLNKTLGDGISYDIDFKTDTSIINPSILLDSEYDLSDINYVYIDIVDRYYFVDNISLVNGTLYKLDCNVDVLMSFKNDIKNLECVISRQENEYNLYLPDSEFKVYAYTDKKTLKFSKTPFTKGGSLLLTVSGGGE